MLRVWHQLKNSELQPPSSLKRLWDDAERKRCDTKAMNQVLFAVMAILAFFSIETNLTLAAETVKLQLKWKHQFQFAGYYTALEKGFYSQAGLEVEILEGAPNLFPIDEVLVEKADYGVAGPESLIHRLHGDPIVVLAAIFQHSPRVIITLKESGIHSPHDLVGKTINMGKRIHIPAENYAMILGEGVSVEEFTVVESFDPEDLIYGRTDAYSGYLTVQPFLLEKRGIAYSILKPITYGIDFYGDCLFTTEREIKEHPKRVLAFRRASLLGWHYAMENPDEIIDLILDKYRQDGKTREHLTYEAENMRQMIEPQLIEIGHMNPGRWKHIADTYHKLGIIDEDYTLKGFLYNPIEKGFDWGHWAVKWGIGGVIAGFGGFLFLLFFNRRLNLEIKERKQVEVALQKAHDTLERRVAERTEELKAINAELDKGVDEVIEALKKINSGDPRVTMSECSTLDSITKLKCMVNTTAKELAEMVGLLHEFAIGLAEHFDILHRVSNGDLEARISGRSQLELLGLLGKITNEMIVSRGRVEKTIREQAARLEWQNRELQDFASVASHDLQEPLRKIQVFGEMLDHEMSEMLSDSARDYLFRMKYAASRMQQLIRALLMYCRVTTKVSPFEKVELKKIAEQAANDIHVPEGKKSPVFEIGDLPAIEGDPIQLYQLFQNLFGNAIRYAQNGRRPVIKVWDSKTPPPKGSKNAFCQFCVQDNGIGFEMKYVDKIFQPFERLHGRGEYEGTGIGLAICRKIVERHGGTITAESEPATGATFIVQLPMRQTH